jgi:hypothetical protein
MHGTNVTLLMQIHTAILRREGRHFLPPIRITTIACTEASALVSPVVEHGETELLLNQFE